MTCTMPITVPSMLCTSGSGVEIRPASISHVLTSPVRCSSTSQA